MRIAISPDEDPGDPGSALGSISERSVNIRVAEPLLDVLLRCGQDAWFDPNITFVERVTRANSDGTQLLVACAHNLSTPGQTGGEGVFCPGGLSFGHQKQAVDTIFQELIAGGLCTHYRGDAVENVYECCAFNGDTVYLELNCMSPDDQRIWGQLNYGPRAAEVIAHGLASVYGFQYVAPNGAAAGGNPMTDEEVVAHFVDLYEVYAGRYPTDADFDYINAHWLPLWRQSPRAARDQFGQAATDEAGGRDVRPVRHVDLENAVANLPPSGGGTGSAPHTHTVNASVTGPANLSAGGG